jgi:hypothetical protein
MDAIFWIGILIGFLLSLAASVVANLFHGRIIAFFDSRKIAKQSNNFKKADAFHKLIEDLHSGKRDKYAYLNRLAARMVMGAVIAFQFITAGLILAYVMRHYETAPALKTLGHLEQ